MTRIASASQSKKMAYGSKKSCGSIQGSLPRKGSKSRIVYDLLTKDRGSWVDLSHIKGISSILDYLELYYGVTIVGVVGRGGRGVYRLRGEWIGIEYFEYPEREGDTP